MNLYLVSNDKVGAWTDEYDAFVMAAESEDEAVAMAQERCGARCGWKDRDNITVRFLADKCNWIEKGEVLGSYNAS